MIKVGDELPQGILRTKTATIHELKTDEMFSGKKVVLFSLPGAFTPTCSAKHLPGFKNLYEDIIERGVDKSRIIATGYGESQPIASNDDEKDGRELNRRVEIKKVSSPQVSTVHE